MQDTDDSDAAPRDMFLNKVKRNKGIAAPFCTRAAALPFLPFCCMISPKRSKEESS